MTSGKLLNRSNSIFLPVSCPSCYRAAVLAELHWFSGFPICRPAEPPGGLPKKQNKNKNKQVLAPSQSSSFGGQRRGLSICLLYTLPGGADTAGPAVLISERKGRKQSYSPNSLTCNRLRQALGGDLSGDSGSWKRGEVGRPRRVGGSQGGRAEAKLRAHTCGQWQTWL